MEYLLPPDLSAIPYGVVHPTTFHLKTPKKKASSSSNNKLFSSNGLSKSPPLDAGGNKKSSPPQSPPVAVQTPPAAFQQSKTNPLKVRLAFTKRSVSHPPAAASIKENPELEAESKSDGSSPVNGLVHRPLDFSCLDKPSMLLCPRRPRKVNGTLKRGLVKQRRMAKAMVIPEEEDVEEEQVP